jgi:hypothetical protein
MSSQEAAMFDSIVAKCTGFGPTAQKKMAVVIPLDRPDLMADAGYEGLKYSGSGARAGSGGCQAAWWMPFHAAAG